jgi:hypothetical protein
MENKPTDERLIEEIRGFREDMRTSVRNALWVFAGSVVLVCLVFGPPLPKVATKDYVAIAGFGVAAVLSLYLVCLIFQGIFNAQIRRRQQRENFAILSGRTAGASRRDP